MINTAICFVVHSLLRLRYRIRVQGLEEVAARGTEGILFLPNHPALIDPIILGTVLHKPFATRFLADETQIDRPVIRGLARRIGARPIPDAAKVGAAARKRVEQALADSIAGLRGGECLILYPAGHVYRQRLEDLRGNSAVDQILRAAPGIRVVLVRTRGLWGSGFSWARGGTPLVLPVLRKGFFGLLASGLFFAPRRDVSIELVEPTDLPREADRETLNRYLEQFYNADAPHNRYVPYSIWENGGARELPEPRENAGAGDLNHVPPATREIVLARLRELTGAATIPDEAHLARDLGLDSLARAELLLWAEKEFGFPAGNAESVRTVADLLRAASGETPSAGPVELRPIPATWFAEQGQDRLALPEGATIPELFLRQAARDPGRAILADQTSGVRTYRDLIAAVFALKGMFAALPGERVGIMLPASVAAAAAYLATLFAGKTPVMVNWTVGPLNMQHALDLAEVQHVLTAEALVKRLQAQGIELEALSGRFVFLEKVARELSPAVKVAAWLRSRLSWSPLRRARISPVAAILFTSGSENLPKAVPLTHENILANLRDVLSVITVRADDRIIGFLPPFHSFGLGETVILPLCAGLPTVYHPNPTEGKVLARLIEGYRATLVMGTPTFLNGIIRAAASGQLGSLRLAVTGAEKCPDRVYAALAERCPKAIVLEGYGITECSPIVSVNRDDAPRPSTIGRPLPSLEWVLVDPEMGTRVEPGRAGLLLVRGPSVFSSYLRYDGPSPFVEFEGRSWYRTGDLISASADGVLTFRGRLKRFAKIGGEMISLPAVESVLEQQYPADADEGPVLAVEASGEERPELVLFTTRPLDRDTVNRQLREAGLSPLYNIRRIISLPEIPVLGTGKTDYRALRKMLT